MVYRTYLFSEAVVEANRVILDSRESHHLIRVLRAKHGAKVEALDGKGRKYLGTISSPDAKAVELEVIDVVDAPKPKVCVTLIQSLPKGKTMDLILRMATEIGASQIQPLFTDQGEVQIKGERLRSKLEKWNATMIESCKQCGLPYLPSLSEPQSLARWLESGEHSQDCLRVVASLEPSSQSLVELLKDAEGCQKVEVAVGPEGDFSKAEYVLLREKGFRPVRLGANVLRSETAAAYILSVVDQLL